jgi:hypothetical protein
LELTTELASLTFIVLQPFSHWPQQE